MTILFFICVSVCAEGPLFTTSRKFLLRCWSVRGSTERDRVLGFQIWLPKRFVVDAMFFQRMVFSGQLLDFSVSLGAFVESF